MSYFPKWAFGLLVGTLWLSACGDDDAGGSSGAGGNAGAAGKSGSLGGTAGKAGTGGSSALGGSCGGSTSQQSGGMGTAGNAGAGDVGGGGTGGGTDGTGGETPVGNGGAWTGGTNSGGTTSGGFSGGAGVAAEAGAGGEGGAGSVVTPSYACQGSNGWEWEDLYPASDGGSDVIALWGASASDVWESRGKHGFVHHFDGAQWTDVPLGGGNVVLSITGTASNDVWAVGTGGLVAHYDGAEWSCAPRLVDTRLTEVWGSSASNVWAVGDGQYNAQGAWVAPATILHFDGVDWSRNTLTWEGTTDNCNVEVSHVWGSGTTDVWISYFKRCTGNLGTHRLVSRWNGTSWTQLADSLSCGTGNCYGAGWAAAPDNAIVLQDPPKTGFLVWNGASWANSNSTAPYTDVWGSSATDIWFTGTGSANHWNGTTFDSAGPSGRYVTGTSSSNAWLFGPGGTRAHWNGASWSDESSTLPTSPARGEGISTIWGSGSDVWAVTDAGHVLRHAGDGWISTGSPSGLKGVWGSSATSLWAVGDGGLVHHFDGHSWTQVSTVAGTQLNAIWGAAPNDIWAVGNATKDSGLAARYHTFTVHYDGNSWTRVAVEAPDQGTADPNDLTGIHGTSSTNVWAVGAAGKLHWAGSSWSAVAGGGSKIWVGGPAETDVRTFAPNAPLWGTSTSDVWSVSTLLNRVYVQRSNGSVTTTQSYGLDQDATVFVPSTIWVGPNDVYIGGGSGITWHLRR
jgi:hypothetical protein